MNKTAFSVNFILVTFTKMLFLTLRLNNYIIEAIWQVTGKNIKKVVF